MPSTVRRLRPERVTAVSIVCGAGSRGLDRRRCPLYVVAILGATLGATNFAVCAERRFCARVDRRDRFFVGGPGLSRRRAVDQRSRLDHDGKRHRQAHRRRNRAVHDRAAERPDDRRRSDSQLPDDGRFRRRDHRLFCGCPVPDVTAAREQAMRMLFDPRIGDGLATSGSRSEHRTSSPRRRTPTTTCPPARPITPSATSASPTTRPRSCRCCARPSG